MLIKKLQTSDAEEIFQLEKLCFPDSFWTVEQIRSHLIANFGIVNFFEKIFGYMLYLENPFELEILRIGVIPEWRKKGLAEELISFLKKKEKEIFLEVSSLNLPALELYKKCGFEMTNMRKKYYRNGSDALILKNIPVKKQQ